MPLLRSRFPSWVCNIAENVSIATLISNLTNFGDTPAAQQYYRTIVADLMAWGPTLHPAAPSVSVLPYVGGRPSVAFVGNVLGLRLVANATD